MELRDYLNVLWARKWVIVQVLVVVTAVALITSFLEAPRYEATTTILISDRDASAALLGTAISDFANSERGLDTQVEVLKSRPILENAIKELNLQTTPASLAGRLNVSVMAGTNVISATVADSDPQRAADTANAIAHAYVEWSRQTRRSSIKAAADEIEARLAAAQIEILELGRKIVDTREKDANGQPIRDDQLTAELTIVTSLYSTLAEKLETLRINEQLEQGSATVIATAVPTDEPESPRPRRDGAFGAALGLVLGLLMAFLIEYLDNSLKSAESLEAAYSVPILGQVPTEADSRKAGAGLTMLARPGTAAAEAYRSLRNALDFINLEHDLKTILFTSAAPAAGKSTVAANLALAMAQAGKRVVLVSCDFRRSTVQDMLEVSNVAGLSEVLTGRIELAAALQQPSHKNLRVLASGSMPPNPSEILGSNRMREVIRSLADSVDWVIIDTPPLLVFSDAMSLVKWVDGVVLSARLDHSTRDEGRRAMQILSKVGARVLGVVAVGVEPPAGGGDYYLSHYYGASGLTAPERESETQTRAGIGRSIARWIGFVLVGLASFLAVLVVIGLVVYGLDMAFGWGVVETLTTMIRP